MLRRSDPSKKSSEVYELAGEQGSDLGFLNAVESLDGGIDAREQPFDKWFHVTATEAKSQKFFAEHYWPDRDDWRRIEHDWLEAAGYEVRKASNCPAGLAEVERAAPALVVTDMCMPGPGGGVIIRSLKQDHPAIPIIAISGHFSLSGCTVDDALALGAARALAKPVKRSEIMQAVAELAGPPGRV